MMTNRLVLSGVLSAIVATSAAAQQRPLLHTPRVDLAVPAGAVTLEIRRDLRAKPTPGILGARWSLVLAGFGDAISLESAASPPATSRDFVDTFDNRKRLISRRDQRGNIVTLAYDPQGRVAKIDGPKGVTLSFTFDRSGKLAAIKSTRGELAYTLVAGELTEVRVNGGPALRYAYGAAGPSRVEDPLTGAMDIAYDPAGRVSAYRWPDGASVRFESDATTQREAFVDAAGNVTTTQNRAGVVVTTDAAGREWTTEFDAARRTRIDTAPDKSITRTSFDEWDRPVTVIDPVGRTTTYTYNDRGDVTAIVLPGGARRSFSYDPFGALVAERVDDQLVRSFTYHPDGTLASARGLNWPERRLSYDAAGFLRAVTIAGRGTTTFERDPRGNATRTINSLGGAITRTFDAQNRLLTATTLSGGTERWQYDDRGRVVEYVDASGQATRLAWDTAGRLVEQTEPAGVTRYEYDAAGRIIRVTPHGQGAIRYAYDVAGRVVSERRPVGERAFEYDAVGRLVRERDALGREIVYSYAPGGEVAERLDSFFGRSRVEVDALGRVARIAIGDAATQYEYDPVGRLRAVVDPLGHERQVTFAAGGGLASSRSADGSETLFAYDVDGLLTSIKRASGGTERLEHDAAGNLTALVSPLGARQTMAYDHAGRVIGSTDANGQTVKYSWDQLDRLIGRELQDGTRHTLTYDAAGRRTSSGDGRHALSYSYDAAGRLTQTGFGAANKTVRFEYDANGQRQRLIDGDGKAVSYEYTAAGQVAAMRLPGGGRIAFAYDAVGRIRTLTYPNGVAGAWLYDDRGRPVSVSYRDASGRVLLVDERRHDAAGNVIERRDGQGRVTRFAYDAGDQLVEETRAGATTRFSYSPGGNRVGLDAPSGTTTYEYDAADQLTRTDSIGRPVSRTAKPARSTTEYAFDRRGALARRGSGSFSFDALQRLTSAPAVDGSGAVTFEYAVTGERLTRRDRTGVSQFLYDGLDLIQELDAAGRTTASYVHGPGVDQPLVMEKGGQTFGLLADLGGNIVAIADSQGRIVSTFDYDAFGVLRERKGTVTSPFGFRGRELDAATGLYYFRARYYDPSLGRFLSTDPAIPVADEPLSFNPYIYVLNNPARFSDPIGLAPTDPLPPDWGSLSNSLQSSLQNGVPLPRGGLASANLDSNQRINLNDLIGGLDDPPPVGPGFRDDGFRRPTKDVFVNQPGRTNPVGPGYRDPGFRRPTNNVFINQPGLTAPPAPRVTASTPGTPAAPPDSFNGMKTPPSGTPVPRPPMSAEQTILDMLKDPNAAPPKVTPPVPAPPRTGPPTAEETIAGMLKQPASRVGAAPGLRDNGFRPPNNFGRPVSTSAPPGTVPNTGSGRGTVPVPGATAPGPGAPPTSQGAAPPSAAGGGVGTPTLKDPIPPPRPAADGNTRAGTSQSQGGIAGTGVSMPAPPKYSGTLTVVLSAAQLIQCVKNDIPLGKCAEDTLRRVALDTIVAAGAVSIAGSGITIVAYQLGGATLATGTLAVFVPGLAAMGAAGGMVYAYNEISSEWSSFVSAYHAVDEADRASRAELAQKRARLARIVEIREQMGRTSAQRGIAEADAVTRLRTIQRDLDELERMVNELDKSAAACTTLTQSQSTLRGQRDAARSRLTDMLKEIAGMRTRVSACRTQADADAVRVGWSRTAVIADQIDADLAQAQQERQRLLTSVGNRSPSFDASAAAQIEERLRIHQEALLLMLRQLPSASGQNALLDLQAEQHASEIARLRSETLESRRFELTRTGKEWIIEAFRQQALDLQRSYDTFLAEIDAEASLMASTETGQARQIRDAASKQTRAMLDDQFARSQKLLERAANSGCRFTDDAEVLNDIRLAQADARIARDEADALLSAADRCNSAPTPLPPTTPLPRPEPRREQTPGAVAPVPVARNLTASLDCGDVLELEAGGRTELCAVHVSGWDSTTRTPVEVLIRPPFSPSSGLSASPGDTSMGGDAMYAAGVQDRPGRYIFSQGWRAERGAPASSTTITVFVRQGSNVVRLPLTLNVIPRGAPTGSTLEPPTPNVAGSGGPYCVWQYKLFGDPVGCWHLVAAGCTAPRYAGRPEYVMVGNNMTRGEADTRIGQLSRYFDDVACSAGPNPPNRDRDPWDGGTTANPDPPPLPEPPAPTREPDPPAGPVSRFSRFGISPRDQTIKVGDAIELQAFATAIGSRDVVLVLDEPEVRWSGDKPRRFTATAADAGRSFRITATGPAGETDTVTISVEKPATTTDSAATPAANNAPPAGAPGSLLPPPARPAAGALRLLDTKLGESWDDPRFGFEKPGNASRSARRGDGPQNFQDYFCGFGGVPSTLEPGAEYSITGSATYSAKPDTVKGYFEGMILVDGDIELVGPQVGSYATNDPDRAAKRAPSAASYRIRVIANPQKATIRLACYPGGTFATHVYGK